MRTQLNIKHCPTTRTADHADNRYLTCRSYGNIHSQEEWSNLIGGLKNRNRPYTDSGARGRVVKALDPRSRGLGFDSGSAGHV